MSRTHKTAREEKNKEEVDREARYKELHSEPLDADIDQEFINWLAMHVRLTPRQ